MANKNNLSFSQRYGFEPIEIPFQINDINKELRIDLWNAFYIFIHIPLQDSSEFNKERYMNFLGYIFLGKLWMTFLVMIVNWLS